MRIFLFLILTVIISSCSQDMTHYQRDPKWVLADEIYDNEIAKNVFSQLKKEKKLHVCESGWDLRGKEKIRCMHCGFDYYNEITLEEAREILVEAISLYLDAINKNERIRPLLNNYPFTAEDIEIRIFLFTPKGGIPEPEKLHFISLTQGKLRYELGSLDPRAYLPVLCEETYEEAIEKLSMPAGNIHIIKNKCI